MHKPTLDHGGPATDGSGRPADLDLALLGKALLRHAPKVVAAAVLAAVAAFGWSSVQTPIYEAAATVLVSQNGLTDREPEPIQIEIYRALIENRALAQKVIDARQLRAVPRFTFSAQGSAMSTGEFLGEVLRVEQLAGVGLLRIHVRLPDAKLAAEVANAVAEEAIQLNRRVSQEQVVNVRDYLKLQLDEAEQRLTASKDRLTAFKETSQIDALKKDVEAELAERSKLLGIVVDSVAEKAKVDAADSALKERERFVTTRRNLSRNLAMLEATRSTEAAGGKPEGLLGLSMDEQTLDVVFQEIEIQLAESRAKYAALESRRREIAGTRGLGGKSLPLLSRLYQSEIELARLELDLKLRERIYTDLAAKYEQSRIDVASRTNQIQLIDAAPVPDTRVSPTVRLNTVLGGMLGLLAALLVVVAGTYLRTGQTEPA